VLSSGAWTVASSNTLWLTANVANGVGNGTFTINARPNPGTTTRTGVITVSGGGITRTINVAQTIDRSLKLSFSWNEDNDRWFLLEQAVTTAGGSTSFNASTNTMTVNVYGVNAQFKTQDPGFSNVPGRGFAVKADTFYKGIVDAAGGQMTFLGVHEVVVGVGTRNYHASVIIFTSDGHLTYLYPQHFVAENSRFGMRYSTIGAGNEDGNLVSRVNRPEDKRLDNKVEMWTLGVFNIDKINNLFAFEENYRVYWSHQVKYPLLGIPIANPYNSNSFAHGLLAKASISTPTPRSRVPGWDNPIPPHMFEKVGGN